MELEQFVAEQGALDARGLVGEAVGAEAEPRPLLHRGEADAQRGGPDRDGGVVATQLGCRDGGGDDDRENRNDNERSSDRARPDARQADGEHDQGGDGDTGQRPDRSSQHERQYHHRPARDEPRPQWRSLPHRAQADQGRQWAEDEREIGGEEVRVPDRGADRVIHRHDAVLEVERRAREHQPLHETERGDAARGERRGNQHVPASARVAIEEIEREREDGEVEERPRQAPQLALRRSVAERRHRGEREQHEPPANGRATEQRGRRAVAALQEPHASHHRHGDLVARDRLLDVAESHLDGDEGKRDHQRHDRERWTRRGEREEAQGVQRERRDRDRARSAGERDPFTGPGGRQRGHRERDEPVVPGVVRLGNGEVGGDGADQRRHFGISARRSGALAHASTRADRAASARTGCAASSPARSAGCNHRSAPARPRAGGARGLRGP